MRRRTLVPLFEAFMGLRRRPRKKGLRGVVGVSIKR